MSSSVERLARHGEVELNALCYRMRRTDPRLTDATKIGLLLRGQYWAYFEKTRRRTQGRARRVYQRCFALDLLTMARIWDNNASAADETYAIKA
jgi:hypothetical protein